MKILNGLYLKDNKDGTYTVSDKYNDLFTGNYNDCICVINHMGTRDNCHIPYDITDEQVEAFKDINTDVQVKVEQYIESKYPLIVEAHNVYCYNIGDKVISLYGFAQERYYDRFKEAFDAIPYTRDEALKQLTKNIEDDFIRAGSKALTGENDADYFDNLGY